MKRKILVLLSFLIYLLCSSAEEKSPKNKQKIVRFTTSYLKIKFSKKQGVGIFLNKISSSKSNFPGGNYHSGQKEENNKMVFFIDYYFNEVIDLTEVNRLVDQIFSQDIKNKLTSLSIEYSISY